MSHFVYNRTNLGNDRCAVTALDKSNKQYENYNLAPYTGITSESRQSYFNSLTHTGIFETGNFEGYPDAVGRASCLYDGGCGNELTNDGRKAKKQLNTRLTLCPPCMQAGRTIAFNPDRMSESYMGELTSDGRARRGQNINRFVPLVPELEKNVQNPKNLVPEFWVHGGMDTRAVIRNIDYLKSCGLKKELC